MFRRSGTIPGSGKRQVALAVLLALAVFVLARQFRMLGVCSGMVCIMGAGIMLLWQDANSAWLEKHKEKELGIAS